MMATETPRQGCPTERKRPELSKRSGVLRGQIATARVASARPVAWRDHVRDAELVLEGLDGGRAHGLGAGQGLLEAAEVDARRVADIAHAVPVPEVGRDRERRLDAGDQLEPDARVLEVGRQ